VILSFGWTAHLLPPTGCKDTTRRRWAKKTLSAWQKAWDEDPSKFHKAYDKSSFVKGAKQIGWLRLKDRPYLEPLEAMPDADVAREGHPELNRDQFIRQYFWKPKKTWSDQDCDREFQQLLKTEFAVIRFEFEPLSMPEQLSIFAVINF